MSARIGCVGLGAMGGPIASAVLRSGAATAVFDVRAEAARPLVESGAMASTSLEELGAFADIVAIVVLNDAQLEAVVLGIDGSPGVLASMRSGSIIVAHSTVSPTLCRRLAESARAHGVGFVDAPISGGQHAAVDGTLTLMVGGSAADVDACEPLFSAVAGAVHHLGDVGAGQIGKLVNNLIGIATRVVVREALALARSTGLDDDVVLAFLRQSSGNSWQVENWRTMQSMGSRALGGPAGMAAIAQKDIELALQLAAAEGIHLPVASAASQNIDGMFGDYG